jgi:hypothetical protein
MGKSVSALQSDGCGKLLGAQLRVDSWQGSLRPEFLIEHLGSPPPDAGPAFECGPSCASWAAEWGSRPGDAGLSAEPVSRFVPSDSATLRLPAGRDLRDRGGYTSALAQVLATGESVVVVGCCMSHMVREAWGHLPLSDLRADGLACAARGCRFSARDATLGAAYRTPGAEWHAAQEPAPEVPARAVGEQPAAHAVGERSAPPALDGQCAPGHAGVMVSEWDVLARAPELAAARVHLIAVDPPYRTEHVALVNRLGEAGVNVHLYYGQDERQTTVRLLRYLVHPRFAMVCVYRALEKLRGDGRAPQETEVLALAAEFAWNEAHVVLGGEQLSRALATLEELGVDQPAAGEAKLEARNIPAYAEAEAEYEECSRLCLNL